MWDRTSRLTTYRFILETWRGRVAAAKAKMDNAQDLGEYMEALIEYERLKNNEPKFPSL